MHDQRKVKEELSEAAKKTNQTAIDEFRAVYEAAFELQRANRLDRPALDFLATVLRTNPEQYTLLAYRRRIYDHLWEADPLTKDTDLDHELTFCTNIISKDFKVYAIWLHRRWILRQLSAEKRDLVLKADLKQCEKLLSVDERNFHVWGYRRWVTSQLRTSGLYADSTENTFTKNQIAKNFSNYSAWHSRGLLLQRALLDPHQRAAVAQQVEEDIDLVTRAVYVDPNDQSAWFYAMYLVEVVTGAEGNEQLRDKVVASLTNSCTELAQDAEGTGEPVPYWITLMRALVLGCTQTEARRHYTALVDTDPARRGFYEDQLKANTA